MWQAAQTCALVSCAIAFSAVAASSQTCRVDVAQGGFEAKGVDHSWGAASISSDGRWALFGSPATNLVPGDTNAQSDVFLADLATGAVERISVDSSGAQSNGGSGPCCLTDDGHFACFESDATNLVSGDTNHTGDVFLRDRLASTTIRVSVADDGSEANGSSFGASISNDGRLVCFSSVASNLVANDTNGMTDIFVRDLIASTTVRVSVGALGVQGNGWSIDAQISSDGRYVAFDSLASNLIAGDDNGSSDVFRRDLLTGAIELVSASYSGGVAGGASTAPRISSDGRRIAFMSFARDVVAGDVNHHEDVFVRDLTSGQVWNASTSSFGVQANASSSLAAISPDGDRVLFESQATNLVAGDLLAHADAFQKNLLDGSTTRVSRSTTGADPNADSHPTALALDGRYALYWSNATNVVADDHNAGSDLFVVDTSFATSTPTVYCTAKSNSAGCRPRIGTSGLASLGGFDAFFLTGVQVLNRKFGFLVWSTSPAAAPFASGVLCVAPPFVRSPPLESGGNAPPAVDCTSGAYSFHFSSAYAASFGIGAGVPLYAQFWMRDPGFAAPNEFAATDAATFEFAP